MKYSSEDCLALFDLSVEGTLDPGWSNGVICQRVRTTKAGPMVYCDCFPVWSTQRQKSEALTELQKEKHREAVRKLNDANAKKKLIRKMNANFGEGAIILGCGYPVGNQPKNEKQANRDIRNLLRRVRKLRKKKGLPDLKYIYITEETESAEYGVRYHHHVVMNGDGLTREEIEDLWTSRHGGTCNTKRYQYQEKHMSGFAAYMNLNKKHRGQKKAMRRRWCCSKNLMEPKPTEADKKISIRKAARIAEAMEAEAREIFAKLYPDCMLLDCEVKRSEWAAGVYIYAELRRKR